MKKIEAVLMGAALAVLIAINIFVSSSENKVLALSSFFIIIAVVFTALLLVNKYYFKSLRRINPAYALCFCYMLLVLTMVFGRNYFSIEWAFAVFIASAVIFYDFKIDSRFLIFPALVLLGYIPFLLIGKFNAIAETTAIYVYYFLVAGVGLQFFEYRQEYENSIDFEKLIGRIAKNIIAVRAGVVIIGIITVTAIAMNRFYEIDFFKWTAVYCFFAILVFYGISLTLREQMQ